MTHNTNKTNIILDSGGETRLSENDVFLLL